MLRRYCLLVILLTLCSWPAFAQQPTSPGPFAYGSANFWNGSTNPNIPGDEHGGVGRTYVVLKANDQITFINRANISNGPNSLPAGMPIQDTQFWSSSISSASVIVPNGPAAPSGSVQVTPNGDGRIYYDPYSPCGDGTGRWIAIEMGNLTYANNSTAAAVLVAISQQEDPNPSDSGVVWTQFAVASTAPANSSEGDSGTVAVDFPRAGFNTNWIAIAANFFFQNSLKQYSIPLTFLFERQPAECSAAIPISPKTLPASGGGSCTGTSGTSTNAWYCNDSLLANACPAVSYHTPPNDPDGSNLFLIESQSGSSGTVDLYEISGAAGSPNYGGVYSAPTLSNQPGPGSNWTWSVKIPDLPQAGTSTEVAPGPNDDRFTSCVVRNSNIYAAQTVGLPNVATDSAAVQWWDIGLDSNVGKVFDVERLGGDGYNGRDIYNSVSPALAVNQAGDVLISFEGVPNTSETSPGSLSGLYAFKSHSGCSDYQLYLPAGGLGPYYPNGDANHNPVRTGDYSQAMVDPLDDTTFWATMGWAGQAGAAGGGYGWSQWWGFISPNTPQGPVSEAFENIEDECPASETDCKVTLTAPVGAQAGDMFFATLAPAFDNTLASVPAGWNYVPWANLGGSTVMTVTDPGFCNLDVANYFTLVHQYGGSGNDSGSYLFKAKRRVKSCSGGRFNNELPAILTSYRGACQNWENTVGTPNYNLQGYPESVDTVTTTIGPVTPPNPSTNPGIPYDNMTLLNYLFGIAESDDSGVCSTMSPISGSPSVNPLASFSGCLNYVPLIIGDYRPANHGQSYGVYTSTDGVLGARAGLQLLLPPY